MTDNRSEYAGYTGGNMSINQNADHATWQQYAGNYDQQNYDQVDDQGSDGRRSTDARSGSFDMALNTAFYDDAPREYIDRSTRTNEYLRDEARPFTSRVHDSEKSNKPKKLRKKNNGTKNGEPKSPNTTRSHKHPSADQHRRHISGKKDHHK